jgi:hypothetical protein
MRGYALTCLALVIGRLEPQRLETILEAFEGHLFQAGTSSFGALMVQYPCSIASKPVREYIQAV